MNTRQLIEKLLQLDPELPVYFFCESCAVTMEIANVSSKAEHCWYLEDFGAESSHIPAECDVKNGMDNADAGSRPECKSCQYRIPKRIELQA